MKMKIGKTAAAMVLAGAAIAGSLVAAAPASATVYNFTCTNNFDGLQIWDTHGTKWCYAWDGDTASSVGWSNFNVTEVCGGVNGGNLYDQNWNYVTYFAPGDCHKVNGNHVEYISFNK